MALDRGRYPALAEDALTQAQREIYERIASGPRGMVQGPLRVWLQSPEMADRAQALGQYVRFDSALTPDLSELAILVTARIWSARFEWSAHAQIAENAGLPPDVIAALGRGERPVFEDSKRARVFDFAVELQRDREVSQNTFEAAKEVLGTPALVDLVAICGYYGFISMSIVVFDVPDEDGPDLPTLDIPVEQMFRRPS